VAGALAGLTTAWIERNLVGAEGSEFQLNLLQRALLAGHVICFYLAKLLYPVNLMFIYPRWTIDPSDPLAWTYIAFVLVATALLWSIRRRTRGPLACWLFFVGTLAPVLGFLNVYPFRFSYVADHFQYLEPVSEPS
jgi:hypothetical protein